MEFRPFRVRLVTSFRGVTERGGVLMRGRGPNGDDAWGEYSPFADYDAARASRWWAAAMEAAHGGWPPGVREDVAVNSIVPEVHPQRAAALAVVGGCTTAKVKVGGRSSRLEDDCARVEAVAGALGAGGRVRVDANGAWDVEQAVTAIRALDAAALSGGVDGLEFVEQPCATIENMALLRKRIDLPIAADESLRVPDDPMAVVRAEAADILVLKVAPLGGVKACLEIAERAGLPVVVSSALETSVGLAAGLALALALPTLPFACGLGTAALLEHDTVAHSLRPVGGIMRPIPWEVTA